MTYKDIKKEAMNLYPAFVLDNVISRPKRKIIRLITLILTFLFLLTIVVPFSPIPYPDFFINYNFPLRGATMVFFSLWIYSMLLESMYSSFYFKDKSIDFSVARHFIYNKHGDILKSFLSSPTGLYTMKRLGISQAKIKIFLKNRKISLPVESFSIDDSVINNNIGILEFVHSIVIIDREFAYFLFENGVGDNVLDGALKWVAFQRNLEFNKGRWLSKEALVKVPSIGRQWSYGHTPTLEDYTEEIHRESVDVSQPFLNYLYKDDVELIANSMLSARDPHVLFISDDSAYSNSVVDAFVREVFLGTVHPSIEDSRVFKINGILLFEELGESFDQIFGNLTNEIISAGNIIPVFENLSQFAELLHRQSKDLEVLLQPFFQTQTPIIMLSDARGYHRTLQTYSVLGRYANIIESEPKSDDQIIRRIQEEVIKIERKTKLFFTYGSIESLVYNIKKLNGKEQITESVLDTLYKIIPKLRGGKSNFITKNDVLILVEKEFKVPQTLTKEGEKEALLNLEALLAERVMGQEKALSAIADTLRRVRAGLSEINRPLGSFLFVGPTGVGKTETAKTLASSYFESEENLMRIDMSEFSSSDALYRMIGDSGSSGRLGEVLGDSPYGVLLLDEFEKAHKDIHNLFLQIIDEGYVTDGRGHELNMRNVIIISTSNAGSDLWQDDDFVAKDYEDKKQDLIDFVISRHVISPELINRFDHTILFKPLVDGSVSKIARKEIELLAKRLEKQGIGLEINNFIVSYLVSKGSSEQFGAREMQRVIKDTIESRIAKEIIQENIKSGNMISFEPSETGEEFDIKISTPTKLA